MGTGTFKADDWDNFVSTQVNSDDVAETFTKVARADFNPFNIKVRQSCETVDKPVVTPIIIALDVTGSMGMIPIQLIQGGLGSLMEKILAQTSIPNPHVMFMAVGDVVYDNHPLQVTQFEADIRIAEQLKDLYLEGRGGPNNSESYPIAWHFASTRTQLDSLKRGEKGIIFTLGDEYAPTKIDGEHLQKFLNDSSPTITTADILAKTQEKFDVFHLGIAQGRAYNKNVQDDWVKLLGQRLIRVDDYTKVDEIIVNTIVRLLQERKEMKERASIQQHLNSRSSVLLNMGGIGSIQAMRQSSQDNLDDAPPPTYEQSVAAFRL
jgi:hypothetical protein